MKSKWPAAIAVAIAAQLMQMLSRDAAVAAAPTPVVEHESCAAPDCASCGRHEPETEDLVAADT